MADYLAEEVINASRVFVLKLTGFQQQICLYTSLPVKIKCVFSSCLHLWHNFTSKEIQKKTYAPPH